MGAVFNEQVIHPEEAFRIICKKSQNESLLSEFLRCIVGKCYITLESTDNLIIYSSPSSPGLFYTKIDKQIILSEDEAYIYKYAEQQTLDEIELFNMIISHQGLIRMPFSTPFGNIKRIIGGCSLVIDSRLNTSYDLYLLKDTGELNKVNYLGYNSDLENFTFLLESTLKLICDFYENKNIFLAKSGGIDSSVLLAALHENKSNFTSVHIPYGGLNSPPEKTAARLCNIFKRKIDIMGLADENERDELIKANEDKSKAGLGTVVGPQYLKFNQKQYFSKKTRGAEANLITGQNLDSLYFLDTFAPSTNEKGFSRFIAIANSIKKRIYFSDIYLDNNSHKWYLKFWPFCVAGLKRKKNLEDYLISFIGPVHEHVVPFNHIHNLPSELKNLEEKYSLFKTEKIVHPIFQIYRNRNGYDDDFLPASQKERNHLIRISKWCRFIHNAHSNYFNLRKVDKINRITPFSEGPMANFFLTYQLTFKDMFYIKRICHDYFNKKSKVRFYGVVKKNDWNIFYNAIIILYQIVKKIPLFNNLIIYLKNNIFKR